MSRGLETTTKAEALQPDYMPVTFISFDLDTPRYYWTGTYDRVEDGHTFIAAGNLISIDAGKEDLEVQANGFSITLSGIDTSSISDVLSGRIRGKKCTIYNALLDEDHNIVGAWWVLAEGKCDIAVIKESSGTSTITVSVESRMVDLGRLRVFRYTQDFQNSTTSNDDRCCEFVLGLSEKKLIWGKGGSE